MFYKKINGEWFSGLQINLPSGVVLTSSNKENQEGWIWYDEAPLEFTLDNHNYGFEEAELQRQTPTSVNNIDSLFISRKVNNNMHDKLFSVAIFLDNEYYYLENLNYSGILTENEITEKVLTYLQNL